MSLQTTPPGGASAPPSLAQADQALGLGLQMFLSDLSPKKREKLLRQAHERAVSYEQRMKVRLLRATGQGNVRPLRGPSAEEVRQRQTQIDAMAMLVRSLTAQLKLEGGA